MMMFMEILMVMVMASVHGDPDGDGAHGCGD